MSKVGNKSGKTFVDIDVCSVCGEVKPVVSIKIGAWNGKSRMVKRCTDCN